MAAIPATWAATHLAVLRAANDLKSDDGENTEYDRALVELTADLLGRDKYDVALLLGIELDVMSICHYCGEKLNTEGSLPVDGTGDWWCPKNPSNGGDAAPHELKG